uniref:Uncharacterized protein n=1 Tax=Rhizophora mucronata TaxID=61149 RepID=A0A2P2MGJ7_RHIMU
MLLVLDRIYTWKVKIACNPLLLLVVPLPYFSSLMPFLFILVGTLNAAFVLQHPLVASAIFGATKSWQLQEVLDACEVYLTPELIMEINKIHARFPNPCP